MFEIRNAVPSDAEAIARMHVDTWQRSYKDFFAADYLDALPKEVPARAKRWCEIMDPSSDIFENVLVAIENSVVVGFVSFGPNRKDEIHECGEIYGIYVSPDVQGAGVGSQLMSRGESWLVDNRFKKAILWTLDANQNSRNFYESKGWTLSGETEVWAPRDSHGEQSVLTVQYEKVFS